MWNTKSRPAGVESVDVGKWLLGSVKPLLISTLVLLYHIAPRAEHCYSKGKQILIEYPLNIANEDASTLQQY